MFIHDNIKSTSRQAILLFKDFDINNYNALNENIKYKFQIRKIGDKTAKGEYALKSNSLRYCLGFNYDENWDNVVKEVISVMGGKESLKNMITKLKARQNHFDILIPVRNSIHFENNYFEPDTISLISRLGLSLGFDFADFDKNDPTHLSAIQDYEEF